MCNFKCDMRMFLHGNFRGVSILVGDSLIHRFYTAVTTTQTGFASAV